MYNIAKSIDLTKEIGCGNFFKFIKDNLESLGEKEALLIIVKGYAEKFTIVEWIKHIGHQVIEVSEDGDIYKISVK